MYRLVPPLCGRSVLSAATISNCETPNDAAALGYDIRVVFTFGAASGDHQC